MKKNIVFILLIVFPFSCTFTQKKTMNWESRDVSARQIHNISVLSDCYGYVRYFYPNSYVIDFDWTKFLMYSIHKIEPIQNDDDLKSALLELFKPLCPQISFSNNAVVTTEKIRTPYFAVEYKAIGSLAEMKSPIIRMTKDLDYSSNYSFKIDENIYVNFPLAVNILPAKTDSYTNLLKEINKIDEGGIGLFSALLNAESVKNANLIFKHLSYRMADLIIRKNIIQHFYPYFHEDGLQEIWDNKFENTITELAQVNNLSNYYLQICNFLSNVKDSHIQIWNTFSVGAVATYAPFYYPDLSAGFANDTCFVLHVGKEYDKQIKKGDVLVSINDRPIHEIIQQKLAFCPHSSYAAGLYRLSIFGNLFESTAKDAILNVAFKNSNNEPRKIQLKTNLSDSPVDRNTDFIKKDENGLVYINLCTDACTYENFTKYISILQSAKGIVFDVRGRPQPDVLSVISHFIHEKTELGNLLIPVIRFPNQENNEYTSAEKWCVVPAVSPESKEASKRNEYKTPLSIQIDKPLVFLSNEKTISFGESFIEMMKYYKVGTIVGMPTAGCNGDVTRFQMPAATFFMTYNKFLNRDGSQHHAVGVLPDVFSGMKIIDIQRNIDTQLETAKKLLQ